MSLFPDYDEKIKSFRYKKKGDTVITSIMIKTLKLEKLQKNK